MWVFDPSYQSPSSKETIAAVDWLRRQVHLLSVDIILGLSPSELVNVEPTDVNLAEMVRLHDVCAEPILFKGSDNRKVIGSWSTQKEGCCVQWSKLALCGIEPHGLLIARKFTFTFNTG